MSKSFERYQRRKLISSYFSVILSIALVLFLLGLLGLMVLNTKKLADYFKEEITLSVFLKDTAKEVEIGELQKRLVMAEYTKSAVFVSKDEAAAEHSEEIGEDFLEFLGYNPLKNSIDVNLNAAYVSTAQVDSIARSIAAQSFVEEVSFDRPTLDLLTRNVKRVGLVILIASGLFTLIAVLLINSSIRLSIYSKRFIIKTMQMVGATKSFIRKPFIWTNIKLGVIGAILALAGLAGLLFYLDQNFPQLGLLEDIVQLAVVFSGVFLAGVLISLISTFFATQRFLNLRTDDLYY
jgi:cell division transport system permease protein